MEIHQMIAAQRAYFATGATRPLPFRRQALTSLRDAILQQQEEICAALYADLGKTPFECYESEIGLVLGELREALRDLPKWAKPKRVKTQLPNLPGSSRIYSEPFGIALIMAPWNYPFQLSLSPLVGALAAGNCVVLKPSAYAPATSAMLRRLLESCFLQEYVAVVEGGREQNNQLLEQRFDFIFFTGSVAVGKLVMEKAAQNLTPVCLELGGKSPCIVDGTADFAASARRIVFGKFLNAGQTCIAPDYLLVQEDAKAPLLAAIGKALQDSFGPQPLQHPELPKIVNKKHFERLVSLMEGQTVALGGTNDGQQRIEPTVLDNTNPASPVMQEEIFGPILPVLTYTKLEEAITFVNSRERPLALYFFSTDKAAQQRVLQECSFGGGCINDTLLHIVSQALPFGGVGNSGMGRYHGAHSFATFSNPKGMLKKPLWPDFNLRYHPYTAVKEKWLRRLLK